MKIKFELDGDPQELREFFGVPNPEQISNAFTGNLETYNKAVKSFFDMLNMQHRSNNEL